LVLKKERERRREEVGKEMKRKKHLNIN